MVPNDTALVSRRTRIRSLPSIKVTITGVTNTIGRAEAGGCIHCQGHERETNRLERPHSGGLQFTMAGPTTDYGYTSFGSDVTTPAM